MTNQDIYIIHGKNYKEMTRQLLETANLKERIPLKETKIGLKPNLVSASEASYGATTHPEVVAGIIEYLQAEGFENMVMLEGSWVGDVTRDAVEVCGYEELSRKYHVPFIDTQQDTYTSVDCAGMELLICDAVKEVEFLINVPVMKGHCQTKLTCALKNMKGLIPNKEKRHFHSMGLHRPIAHLNKGIKQDFIVVDNICGDLDFEDGGHPVEMNRVWACADPVLCDAYVCEQLEYTLEEVPYIGLAESLGVGSADLTKMKLHFCGDEEEEREKVLPSRTVEVCDMVQEVDSCSACYGYLIPALYRLKEEGIYEKISEKICIGQGFRGKNGTLGVGNCTKNFKMNLKGCPPTEEQIYEFLKEIVCLEEKGNIL